MTKPIGIGVIGMGWMGQVHSRSYRQVPDRFRESGITPRLIVCSDNIEARAKEANEYLDFENWVTDWKEVIANPEVEAVNITTPNHLHLEIVRAAAGAGKHVYCEKPVGMSTKETAEIESLAREAGILSLVGFNYRWAPLVQYAHQLISEGKLGELTHYRGRFLVGYASNPEGGLSWRFIKELAGLGALGDLMSHVTNMAHFLAGPIKEIIGSEKTFIPQRPIVKEGETHFTARGGGEKGDVTNEDYAGALVKFSNGAQGSFEVCRIISGMKCQMAFEVHGTKGALNWNFEKMNEMNVFLPDENNGHDGFVTLYTGPDHPYHANFNPGPANSLSYEDLKIIESYNFLRSIRDNKQADPGFDAALKVAEVHDAILRSWDSKQWEAVTPINID